MNRPLRLALWVKAVLVPLAVLQRKLFKAERAEARANNKENWKP